MATETAVDVVMPQMGVSVSEGTITRWLKQEGEHVEADEPLLEISTDKVDTEVPSPASGTLSQILVQEGQTVDVGTKLGQIGGGGGGAEPAPEPEPEQQQPEPATREAAREADAPSPAETPQPVAEAPAPQQPAPQQPAPQQHVANGDSGGGFVSPVVARIASEHGVDPNQVSGSGRGGRVTKKDILAFIEQGGAQQQQQQQQPAQPQQAALRPSGRVQVEVAEAPRLRRHRHRSARAPSQHRPSHPPARGPR